MKYAGATPFLYTLVGDVADNAIGVAAQNLTKQVNRHGGDRKVMLEAMERGGVDIVAMHERVPIFI